MKKLLSIALALVLILSMSIVASADEVKYAPTEATSFSITKTYTSDETFVPGETLKFTIDAVGQNPTDAMISIGTDNSYVVTGLTNTITVTVPSFTAAGEYNWTIKEQKGSTAGVTSYDTEKTIYVTALVGYNNERKALEIVSTTSFIKKNSDGTKTSEFVNVFQTNNFTVAKDVEGNMANLNDEFDITVTLTSAKPVLTSIQVGGTNVASSEWAKTNGSYTYTTTLSLSEAAGATTFANIPYGVQVSVVEDTTDENLKGYTQAGYAVNGTDVSTVSFTIDDEDANTDVVVVKNTKSTTVDTGITMDSMPYVLLLAVACFGMVVLFSKKRMMREN